MNILDIIRGWQAKARSITPPGALLPVHGGLTGPAFFPEGFGLQNPTSDAKWPNIMAIGHNFGCEDYRKEIDTAGREDDKASWRNLRRLLRNVMSACLAALHFRETGEKIPAWSIVLPMLGFPPDATAEEIGLWREQLQLFTSIPFVIRETNSPQVFQYAVGEMDGGRVYAMKFYSGFLVFGYRAPTEEELAAIEALN